MGFILEFKKALNGQAAGEKYVVAGIPVICSHCKSTRFYERDALLDDRVSSALGVEAFSDSATTLTCAYCGRVEWFADCKVIERV